MTFFKQTPSLLGAIICFCFLSACDSSHKTQTKTDASEDLNNQGASHAEAAVGVSEELEIVANPPKKVAPIDEQQELLRLLDQVPADSAFIAVVRDLDGLASSQIPELEWDFAKELITDLFLNFEIDMQDEGNFPNPLNAAQNQVVCWVHPGSVDVLKANLDAKELFSKTLGWLLGNLTINFPILGNAAFDGMTEFPFEDDAEKRARQIEEAPLKFGVTMAISGKDGFSDENLEEYWSALQQTPGVERVSFELDGIRWQGVQWRPVEEDEHEFGFRTMFDPFGIVRLKNALLEHGPVFVVGMRDNQQFWFYGTKEAIAFRKDGKDQVFDPEFEKYLISSPGKIHLLTKTAPELANLNWLIGDSLTLIAEGYSNVLKSSGLFADVRVLDAVLERLAKNDQEVIARRRVDEPVVSVVYDYEGLVYEQIGGAEIYGIDYETPQVRINHKAFADSTWCYLQGRCTSEAFQTMKEQSSLIANLADQGISRLLGETLNEGQADDFGPFLAAYDSALRKSVSGAADAIYDFFGEGLEDEWAFVIDAEGQYPSIPDMPAGLIEKGRAPRFSLSWPVKSRSTLGSSWDAISESLDESVATIVDEYSIDFTVPKPLSDEGDDRIKHYYYTIPFTNNNCLPCLSLNDNALALGSAKKMNQASIAAWQRDESTKETFTGVRGSVRVSPLVDIFEDLVKYGGIYQNDQDPHPLQGDEGAEGELSRSEKIFEGIRRYEVIDFAHYRKDGSGRYGTRFHLKKNSSKKTTK